MTGRDQGRGQWPNGAGSSDVGKVGAYETIRRAREPAAASSWADFARRQAEQDLEDRRQDVELKRSYGWRLLQLLIFQLGIADATFVIYGFMKEWNVDAEVMVAWLSAAVVQVVGLAWVVVRSLFPPEPPKPRQPPT